MEGCMVRKGSEAGFTLVEIMLATGILVFALCGILAAFISCAALSSTSKNINIATNAALEISEQIRTTSFSYLSSPVTKGLRINGQPFAETFTGSKIYNCHFSVAVLPENSVTVYIDTNTSELLGLTVSVCWKQNNRVIGEDKDLDGELAESEDANANELIDSPVQIVTRVGNR
jgi:hypothetical protein